MKWRKGGERRRKKGEGGKGGERQRSREGKHDHATAGVFSSCMMTFLSLVPSLSIFNMALLAYSTDTSQYPQLFDNHVVEIIRSEV